MSCVPSSADARLWIFAWVYQETSPRLINNQVKKTVLSGRVDTMPRCGEDNVDDIEDLLAGGEAVRAPPKRHVLPKKIAPRGGRGEQVERSADSNIPGVQTIYVKTWGCSHNNSDGEYMAGQLAAYGYHITDDALTADLWLLNSCTVKGPSEDSFRNAIASGQSLNKHLVMAGCVPQGHRDDTGLRRISAVGVQQIDRVVEVVEETLKGHTVRLFGTKKTEDGQKGGGASLDLPKIRKNPLIEILAINTGCLNQCTYCKTKHARGELGSYPPEQLVARAKQAFKEGVREIWLTSEDLGAYGHDIGVRIPELLWQLVEVIPEGAMMRLGMTNPPYIMEHMEEIAKILNHPRVYSFLHVPVQAASDLVLEAMKREYTRADFEHVVDYLKEKVPRVTIATDLICGFPTETEEDFKESIALVEKYKFPSLFINQFYPRPGTPAARMKRIPTQEVKNRSRAVSKVFQSYRTYDHQVGERQWVLVTEIAHDKKKLVSHNKSYDQVLLDDVEGLMGKYVQVDIVSAGKHFLIAKLVPGTLEKAVKLPEPFAKGAVSGVSLPAAQSACSSGGFLTRQKQRHVVAWCLLALFVALLARSIQLVQLPKG